MGIKTVPHCPYSPDLAPCDFCLFPKLKENLRGCRYETIEEMKEAVIKVIDMLTQEDFHGAFQKLLEWYNKCIAAGGEKCPYEKSLETYWRHLILSILLKVMLIYFSKIICFATNIKQKNWRELVRIDFLLFCCIVNFWIICKWGKK